jgi:hypothetical protein
MTGQSHDYKRNGTTTLFAAFDVSSGEVIDTARPFVWTKTGVHQKRLKPCIALQ